MQNFRARDLHFLPALAHDRLLVEVQEVKRMLAVLIIRVKSEN